MVLSSPVRALHSTARVWNLVQCGLMGIIVLNGVETVWFDKDHYSRMSLKSAIFSELVVVQRVVYLKSVRIKSIWSESFQTKVWYFRAHIKIYHNDGQKRSSDSCIRESLKFDPEESITIVGEGRSFPVSFMIPSDFVVVNNNFLSVD